MLKQNELQTVADIFASHNKDVFAVGGYVRNKLLNIEDEEISDIDICSSVTPNELVKMFKNTEFEIKDISNGLGVCVISKGDFKCEHATFRKETYRLPGEHIPNKVVFTDDIYEDSKRRDFTINCVYLSLTTGLFVDPYGGIEDIKKRIVKTILSPSVVFNMDGIRVLRMIRFACALGFDIDEETFAGAKRNSHKLILVNKSLIKREFDQMLVADMFYPMLPKTKSAHLRALTMIGDMGLWRYILPEMNALKEKGILTKRKYETVYEHSLRAMFFAPPELRLPALLHDVGMLSYEVQNKKIKNVSRVSADMILRLLPASGLGYSNAFVEQTANLVEQIGYDMEGKVNWLDLRKFIIDNSEIIDDIINLKIATEKAVAHQIDVSSITCGLQKEYVKMLTLKIPTRVQDMVISGADLIQLYPQLEKKKIASILDEMLRTVAIKSLKNDYETLVKLSKKLV